MVQGIISFKLQSVSNLSPTSTPLSQVQTLLHCFLCHHSLLHHFPCHHILLRLFPYCHALLHPLPLSPHSHCDSTVYVGSFSDQEEFDPLFEQANSPVQFPPPSCAEPTDFHSYSPQLPNHLTLSLLGCQMISIFAKASPDVTGTGEAC